MTVINSGFLRRTLALLVAIVAPLASTACHTDPASPSPTPSTQQLNWPQNLADFRFRWTAEPTLVLDAGWAVPLRAYVESLRIIDYTGDLDAGYPGLQRVTPEPEAKFSAEWKKLPIAQRDLRGTLGRIDSDNPDRRFVGSENFHVLRTEPIPSGFRAIVCDDTFAVFKASGDSKFAPLYVDSTAIGGDPDFWNMSVWRIEFSERAPRRGATPPANAPTSPQRGPLPAPHGDVFGPWFVTGAIQVSAWHDSDFPGLQTGTPEYEQRLREAQAAESTMRQQCLAHYPLNAEQRTAIATMPIDAPPEMKPAAPGWPDGTAK